MRAVLASLVLLLALAAAGRSALADEAYGRFSGLRSTCAPPFGGGCNEGVERRTGHAERAAIGYRSTWAASGWR